MQSLTNSLYEGKLQKCDLFKPDVDPTFNIRLDRFIQKSKSDSKFILLNKDEVLIPYDLNKDVIDNLENLRGPKLLTHDGKTVKITDISKTAEWGSTIRVGLGSKKTEVIENNILYILEKVLIGGGIKEDEIQQQWLDMHKSWLLGMFEIAKTCKTQTVFRGVNTSFIFERKGKMMKLFTEIAKFFGKGVKDNWNPADIFIYNPLVFKELKDWKKLTLQQVNGIISNQYNFGNLIPISLKKVGKTIKYSEHNVGETIKVQNITDFKVLNNFNSEKLNKRADLKFKLNGNDIILEIRPTHSGIKNIEFMFKIRGALSHLGRSSTFIKNVVKEMTGQVLLSAKEVETKIQKGGLEKNIIKKIKYINKVFYTSGMDKTPLPFIENLDELDKNMKKTDITTYIAINSKVQIIEFLYILAQLKQKKQFDKFWNQVIFSALKIGDQFSAYLKIN